MTAHQPNIKAAKITGGVHSDTRHDSAHKHVTGDAVYIDDMPEPAGTLHIGIGQSSVAHGKITKLDLSAVRTAPGVVDVLTAKDVPGENDISPSGMHDDPIFADGLVQFHGQPIFAVVAETREQARAAARLAKVEYKELPATIEIWDLDVKTHKQVTTPLTLKRGDAAKAIADAPHRLKGRMWLGGQEHFYLEGQVSVAVPGEDEEVHVYSSTQGPSETQHLVAHALGVPSHSVRSKSAAWAAASAARRRRRNQGAAIAAIAAKKLKRAVKMRMDRDEDMTATGKRHDFAIDYEVGFDDEGRILGIDYMFALSLRLLGGPVRAGRRPGAVPLRQRLFLPACACAIGAALHQHRVQHRVSRLRRPAGHGRRGARDRRSGLAVGKDPLEIRKLNFYDAMGTDTGRNVTPYHQRCRIASSTASSPSLRKAATISAAAARSAPSTRIAGSSSAASR
jgi:xanthine dehydrogenase large subunit